jgi:Mn-dependent DtxR family transcriptional regulator
MHFRVPLTNPLENSLIIWYGFLQETLRRRFFMRIQESGEMYLETILILSREKQYVRSIDVCEYMGYSKPSISRAVSLLRNSGYVDMDDRGYLSLTDSGRAIAEKIYERHLVLSTVLKNLGVDEKAAVEDACRIEHVISDETFAAIKDHISRMEGKA